LFSDINVSQGSVATYGKSGGIFNNFYCEFTRESACERILKIGQDMTEYIIMIMVSPFFMEHGVDCLTMAGKY